ncbi:hypothetical protein GYMLUDRAFT_35870 [Collybiopsis luxurians FD-317 M1]|nr:hypothetical protein GYMLUDRAFT_35870 [Collybiopsis luxurians FD-317 M1]
MNEASANLFLGSFVSPSALVGAKSLHSAHSSSASSMAQMGSDHPESLSTPPSSPPTIPSPPPRGKRKADQLEKNLHDIQVVAFG